ncbi:MAG: RHS repeat domain-containing protein [Simkaniaceae bacterium]
MIRLFLILIGSFFVLPAFSYDNEAREEIFLSTPEQIATLSYEPQFLVGGVISPLSGSPTLKQTDFIVKGAQEIVLNRTYLSPRMPAQFSDDKGREKYDLFQYVAYNYKGWQFFPHLKLQLDPRKKKILLTESSGCTLQFSFTNWGFGDMKFEGEPYGLSNLVGEMPSGAHDPRNTRILSSEGGKVITVFGTDRGKRIYQFEGRDSKKTQLYLLEKEILPNGKVLKYHYENRRLVSVKSLDPRERFVYASICIDGSPWEGNVHFQSCLDQVADYEYERRVTHAKIKKTVKHWLFDDQFRARYSFLCPPILTKVNSPNFKDECLDYCGRFLLRSYEGGDLSFQVTNKGFGDFLSQLYVHELFLPVARGGAFAPVYQLSYQLPVAGEKSGRTCVKASDGTSILYHFSKNLLTTQIQYFDELNSLKKEKNFSWDEHNWLLSVEFCDEQNKLFYKKSFEYDCFGNPTLEVFMGDLSGLGDVESTWTKRAFSDDGKNLLLQEEREDGLVTSFCYLQGTNLLTSKFVKDSEKIILRDFWVYDDCYNLIEKVSDDGKGSNYNDLTGVSERHKTTYILRQTPPFLHMPEWIIESYGDGELLRKSHLIYDAKGNVIQEEVFDAEGDLAFVIQKTYNERGDLLSETNRLGRVASYSYDNMGRRITETNFSGRGHKSLFYDKRGRLSKIEERGEGGGATCCIV